MRRLRPLLPVLLLLLACPATAQEGARRQLGPSGLPLPRFASLNESVVNMRTGPGQEYPPRWVYVRKGLPVRILEEYPDWRRIEDADGVQGWTHSRLLSTRRTVMVRASEPQALYRSNDRASRVLLRAENGVIGGFNGCDGDWCQVEIEDQRGWMPRDALWGTLPSD